MSGVRAPEEQRRREILRAAFTVAARERLTGVRVQDVAKEAGVSKGLVFFYFENKETLLVALLEWLLERTIIAGVDEQILKITSPQERFLAVLRQDIERLPAQRRSVELFFDFWVMGTRHPDVQRMIRGALNAYRDALRGLAQAVIEAEPERYQDVTADGLAAVAAGFIEGCALQIVMDPDRFDVEEYLTSLNALVARNPTSTP